MFFKEGIKGLDIEAGRRARERWDAIAKPIYGLGRLEDMLVRIAEIQGSEKMRIKPRAILVMCADNGIVEEGVTQTDASVTAAVAENMAKGCASVNRMCAQADTDVITVDVGIKYPVSGSCIIRRKVSEGTRNFLKSPAMTKAECLQAVETGIGLVKEYQDKGYVLLGTGEMGIGNTTTASALVCGILGLSAKEAVGRGAGLSDTGYAKKIRVVEEALGLYPFDKMSVFDMLCAVGGLDIAALVGVFLGGARFGVPIVIDGAISAAAALTAERMQPGCVDFMLPSHKSREKTAAAIFEALFLEPVIDGKLALGEGTGAALLFPMLDMALSVYDKNATFSGLHIEAYQKYEEKGGKEG